MTYDDFTHALHASMAKMMQDMHAVPASGRPDVDFLAMMIPHHEGAVEMARLVLIQGHDPLVRQLAGDIIAGQTTEIAAMRGRLDRLEKGANEDPDGFPAPGSTRGPAR